MKQVQQQHIWYNFDLNQPDPLDARFRIPSLSALAPIEKRYAGLPFFVVDENTPYIFLNDLTTPIKLIDLINSNSIFGITSVDYSTLLTSLNATNPVLGSLVTVFPLNITFIFDGTNWNYHSGDYHVTNETQFNTIPAQLIKPNKLVLFSDETRYITLADLSLSAEVIIITELPSTFEDNRYYKLNSNLYYSLNGIFYNIGNQTKVLPNTTLINGSTVIEHNLNSAYISAFFWINNTSKVLRLSEYDLDGLNKIIIESYMEINGTLILSTIY